MIVRPQIWWPGIDRQHPQARGLVGAWLFQEGAGSRSRNLAGPGHHLAHNNMAPSNWIGGPRGWALSFDNANSEYLEVDTAVISKFPMTMCGWINSDDLTINQMIVGVYGTASNTEFIAIGLLGGVAGDPARAIINTVSGNSDARTTVAYSANTWHHVCGVFPAGGTSATVYLDGGNEVTDTGGAPTLALVRTAIGRRASLSPALYVSGFLDDVRIYNRALSRAEVRELIVDPYGPFRIPAIHRRQVAAVGGLSIPVAMNSYRRRRVYA